MTLHFACTQCGKCCRDAKLPLTVAEAIGWLGDGNDVQVICEAEPWPAEPSRDDAQGLHRRGRSFAAVSGTLPSRVTVVLAGNLEGRCPNLQADLSCGIYARRPLVCRIYPAEINPFIELNPVRKSCPPEAWTEDRPVLVRARQLVDETIRRDIATSRETDVLDTAAKESLCAALGIDRAGLAYEGVVVYSPSRRGMLDALGAGLRPCMGDSAPPAWRYVSNRPATVIGLTARGGAAALVGEPHAIAHQYFGAPNSA